MRRTRRLRFIGLYSVCQEDTDRGHSVDASIIDLRRSGDDKAGTIRMDGR